jgi:hypothetical protein
MADDLSSASSGSIKIDGDRESKKSSRPASITSSPPSKMGAAAKKHQTSTAQATQTGVLASRDGSQDVASEQEPEEDGGCESDLSEPLSDDGSEIVVASGFNSERASRDGIRDVASEQILEEDGGCESDLSEPLSDDGSEIVVASGPGDGRASRGGSRGVTSDELPGHDSDAESDLSEPSPHGHSKIVNTSSPGSEKPRREVGEDDEGGYEGDDDDEHEEDDAPVPDEAFEAAANDEPSSYEEEAEDDEEDVAPAALDASKSAPKHELPAPEGEVENDRASLPATSFEEIAKRATRKGKRVSSSSNECLSSEYDSEDIIVAPRRSQRESTDVKETPEPRSSSVMGGDIHGLGSSPPRDSSDPDDESRPEPNGASSELSDLGATPEPSDPELMRLAREQIRRKLDLCQCEGWCSCERYKIFYGSSGPDEVNPHAAKGTFAQQNDKAGPPAKGKRKRASNIDTEHHDDENVFENPSSSQSLNTNDSKTQSREEAEESDSELPSQTHLSERVLANEQFPESAMRSTINHSKRRKVFESERAAKRTRTEQTYSWDRGVKPTRPPAGWAGGEWVRGHYEVQDSAGEEGDVDV